MKGGFTVDKLLFENLTIKKPEILQSAISTFGVDSQLDMAIEEMAELTKEILKTRRASKFMTIEKYKEATENVKEEIADVLIMIAQLIIIYGCHYSVQEQIDLKVERLAKTIEFMNSGFIEEGEDEV